MAKGFLKGVLWGSVFSVGASVVAVMLDRETASNVSTTAEIKPKLAPGTLPKPADRDGDPGSAVAGLAAQNSSPPEPDTLAALVSDTLAPAAVPLTGVAPDLDLTLQAPQSGALRGVVTMGSEPPRVGFDTRGALQTPATESGLSISTDPAQPVAPDLVPTQRAFETGSSNAPTQPELAEEPASDPAGTLASSASAGSARVARLIEDPAQPLAPSLSENSSGMGASLVDPEKQNEVISTGVEAPKAATAGEKDIEEQRDVRPSVVADMPIQPTPEPAETALLAALPLPEAVPDQPIAADLPAAEAGDRPTPDAEGIAARVRVETDIAAPVTKGRDAVNSEVVAPVISAVPEAPAAQRLATAPTDDRTIAPEATETAPVSPSQAAPLPRATVRVNQLPNLAQPETVEPPEDVETVVADPVEDLEPPVPFERFSVPFENPDAKPVLGVILMDDGVDLAASGTHVATVSALPFPVSFAVDALLPDAAARMKTYRDAGFEVLAMVDLPAGATAGDAEVNLSAALDAMPEAIAVLGGVDTGVQTTSEAALHVAQILAQTGHGLITQNRGLNTAQKLAVRQGVPSAVVFRDFDGSDQSAAVMRRYLDQAAFRAGQDGGVVMLGRLREETLSTLALWALQERASRVAMAPVSAVLREQDALP